jgi:peptidoglycan/LPS O-acetylase OafA/YrhL
MRSSSGAHYIALDHIRALAAFLVVTWHFLHTFIPYEYVPPVFLLSLLDEGHTGVALFMTFSGYLFAKLLEGRPIIYTALSINSCWACWLIGSAIVWTAGMPLPAE